MSNLSTELQDAKYGGLTDQECLDLLNLVDIPVPQSISTHDIQKYLELESKLEAIENSVSAIGNKINRVFRLFPTFDMEDVQVEGALVAVLDLAIIDGLIDSADKTVILDMGIKLISRAQELSFSKVTLSAINNGRT